MGMFDGPVIESMRAEWQPPDDPPTPGDPDELPDSPPEQPPDEPPGFPEPDPEQPPAEPPELSADTHLPQCDTKWETLSFRMRTEGAHFDTGDQI